MMDMGYRKIMEKKMETVEINYGSLYRGYVEVI